AVEKLPKRDLALGPVEDIGLVDLEPRKRATLLRQAVAEPRQLLLLGEEHASRLDPACFGDNGMSLHRGLLPHSHWRRGAGGGAATPSGPASLPSARSPSRSKRLGGHALARSKRRRGPPRDRAAPWRRA